MFNVVITGTGAYYDFQLGSGIHNLGVDFVGTDNQTVGALDSLEQVGTCAFLNYLQFVTGSVNHIGNSLDCCGSKRLLCENEYLHFVNFLFGGLNYFRLAASNSCMQAMRASTLSMGSAL